MEDEVYNFHRDNEDSHWWFVGRRHVLSPLIDFAMRGRSDGLIVDVGCGTGGTVAELSGRYPCVGIDHSEQAIAMARQKYPGRDFVCGSVQEITPALSDRAALWTLMDVLEHIEDDRAFLAGVVTAMRPGSHFLITVPARMVLWSGHDVAASHVRRYEEADFRSLWQGMDLDPVMVTFFNARLYPLIWTARVVGRRFGMFSGKGGQDLAVPPAVFNAVLTRVVSGERARIEGLLRPGPARPFRHGSSLLALLRRR